MSSTLIIEALSHDFKGIARRDGKTCFVESALPGETVKANQLSHKKSFEHWGLVSVLDANEHRIKPQCEYFAECGGCQWQYCLPEAQIEYKQEKLQEQLQRISQLNPDDYQLALPIASQPWAYRRKIKLASYYDARNNCLHLGFRAAGSKKVIDVDACLVAEPRISQLIKPLRNQLQQLQLVAKLGHVEIFAGDADAAILLTIRVATYSLELSEHDTQLVAALLAKNVLIGLEFNDKTIHLGEQQESHYTLNQGVSLEVLPGDFVQANAGVNAAMVDRAIELMDLNPEDTVVELFSGIGNFSLAMSTQCAQIHAYEGSQASVEKSRHNAQRNQCDNIDFYCANLSESLPIKKLQKLGVDKVLIDPPRDGAQEVIPAIIKLQPKRLVYISCNPSTLARDAKLLYQSGYKLEQVAVIDMFPQTYHSESIAAFVLDKKLARDKPNARHKNSRHTIRR